VFSVLKELLEQNVAALMVPVLDALTQLCVRPTQLVCTRVCACLWIYRVCAHSLDYYVSTRSSLILSSTVSLELSSHLLLWITTNTFLLQNSIRGFVLKAMSSIQADAIPVVIRFLLQTASSDRDRREVYMRALLTFLSLSNSLSNSLSLSTHLYLCFVGLLSDYCSRRSFTSSARI
jgi:hypothetical protein